MIAYYDSSGAITSMVAAASPDVTPPPNPGAPLYLDDTQWADVWAHPGRYLIQGGAPVLQPYLTLATATDTTTSPPTVTVTATLTSGTATEVAFTVGQSSETVALTNGEASIALQPHASVQALSLPVQASAAGTVGASVDVGIPGGDTFTLQLVPPMSGSTYLIAPVGQGSKAFLRAWSLGFTAETQLAVLTEALQDLYVTTSSVMHLLTSKIVPALQAASYAPITLDAAETAALDHWQANLQPNLFAMSGLLDSSGSPIPPYSEAITNAPGYQQALSAYGGAVAAIPGLE